MNKDPTRLEEVETEIKKRLPEGEQAKCNKDDIRLSVPGLPPISGNALIQTKANGEIRHVEEYFPVRAWTDAYAHNKWHSYVYAPRSIADPVRDAAISVIAERFQMDIDVARSNQSCHR